MSLIRRFATPLSGQTQRSAPELAASLQAARARCRPEAELLQPRGRTAELHGHHASRGRHRHAHLCRRHDPVRHPPGWCNAAAVCNPCSASRHLVLRRMARIIRADGHEDHEPACGKGECSGMLHSRVLLQCAGSWAAAHSPRPSSSPPCSRHNGFVRRSSRVSPVPSVQASPCMPEAEAEKAHLAAGCRCLRLPPPSTPGSGLHLHGLSIAQRVCAHRR